MNITKNTVVELKYNVQTKDGEVLDPGTNPMAYLHGGYHGIFPKVEAALEGKTMGETIEVTLQPEDHYGEHRPELIHEVPRKQLPADIEPNMVLEARNEETGDSHLVTVIELNEHNAKLDGNHPLAGITLVFNATIQNVRAATEEEITHGHAHGEHGAH